MRDWPISKDGGGLGTMRRVACVHGLDWRSAPIKACQTQSVGRVGGCGCHCMGQSAVSYGAQLQMERTNMRAINYQCYGKHH